MNSLRQRYINALTVIVRNIRRLGIIPVSPLINDRSMEYGFAAQHLGNVQGMKILDVGFLESTFPFILAGLGAQVYGLDLRPCPIAFPGLTPVVGDIRKTEFPDGFFDSVLAISTVEHLGIHTRYQSYHDTGADRTAVLEMQRIVKPDGKIILTVPFGKWDINSVQRTYDLDHIHALTEGLAIEHISYAKNTGRYWTMATYDEVKDTVGYHANILLTLTHKK